LRAIAYQNEQRLTHEQEQFLVEWIPEEDARGYPPPHARASEMAIEKGLYEEPGESRVGNGNRDYLCGWASPL